MILPTFSPVNRIGLIQMETRIKAETEFNLLEQIKKPVSVKAKAFTLSTESDNGMTKARAKVVFYLVYLSEDGYKKVESETEVVGEFQRENLTVTVKACDAKVQSNGQTATASVIFSAEGKIQEEKDCLSGGEGVIIKERCEDFDFYYKAKDGRQTVSDEFEVNYPIGEVLSYGCNAYLNSVTCGLGRIIFEGEAILTVKALPFAENNDIVKERKIIPFRYELDLDDAMPEMRASGNVEVVTTNVKVFADEAKSKSAVSVDVVLCFSGEAVSSQTVTLAEDAYVKESYSDVSHGEIESSCFNEQKCVTQKLTALAGVAIDGGRVITSLGESVAVYSVKCENGLLTVDGGVKCDVVFKNADNGITSVNAETPFSFDFTVEGIASSVKVVLVDLNARVRNGEIEIDAQLKVSYKSFIDKKVRYVDGITEKEKRNGLDSAISVYLPNGGDGIWEIAKELGVTEEEIRRYNGDLEFPLAENDRVIIYRQKI